MCSAEKYAIEKFWHRYIFQSKKNGIDIFMKKLNRAFMDRKPEKIKNAICREFWPIVRYFCDTSSEFQRYFCNDWFLWYFSWISATFLQQLIRTTYFEIMLIMIFSWKSSFPLSYKGLNFESDTMIKILVVSKMISF